MNDNKENIIETEVVATESEDTSVQNAEIMSAENGEVALNNTDKKGKKKNRKQKKNSAKKLLAAVIAVVIVAALAVGGFAGVKLLEKSMPATFEPPTPTSGKGTGYYRHCYEELGDSEKLMYAVILQSIYSMPEKIEVPSLTEGDFSKVFEALSYDNPDLFCLGVSSKLAAEGKKTYFIPEYSMSYEEYSAKLTEVNGIASAIASNAVTYTSEYERELYIHDYIINHCTYALGETNGNDIYGCLVNGKASCEGYSRAFQYILSAVGIDNRLVTGEASDAEGNFIGHMWNYVIIGGDGYFTDVTWDDPSSDSSVLRHTYFNNTTAEILVTHRDIRQAVPFCNATKFNFFVYENSLLQYGDEDALRDALERIIKNSQNRGYKCAEMRFESAEAMEWALEAMFKKSVIFDVYTSIGLAESMNNNSIYYSSDDKAFAVCLYY